MEQNSASQTTQSNQSVAKPLATPLGGPGDLLREFSKYFEVVPAFTDELKSRVYQIRYEVYADELGWENAAKFPQGLEQDTFDKHSVHCLLRHVPTDNYIGCVRLVLNNPTDANFRFPLEQACGEDYFTSNRALAGIKRADVGEISRIAVLSSFRHRTGEKNSPHTDVEEDPPSVKAERRRFPHIALGLYLAAAAINLELNKQSGIAMMEPKLARRLRIFGIRFEQIGDPIDHHGIRAPFQVSRECFENGLAPPMNELLHFIREKFKNVASNAA